MSADAPEPDETPPEPDDEVVEAEVVDDVQDADVVDAETVDDERGTFPFAEADLGAGSVEGLIADLETTVAQRDEYLDTLRRTQADFENYRKRMLKQQSEAVERAVGAIIEQLLPTLDVGDAAAMHGQADAAVFSSLLGALEKTGLERIEPTGEPFDPNDHEAVMHEPGDSADSEPRVVETMRAGYAWKGRLLRPAMVKVRG